MGYGETALYRCYESAMGVCIVNVLCDMSYGETELYICYET